MDTLRRLGTQFVLEYEDTATAFVTNETRACLHQPTLGTLGNLKSSHVNSAVSGAGEEERHFARKNSSLDRGHTLQERMLKNQGLLRKLSYRVKFTISKLGGPAC